MTRRKAYRTTRLELRPYVARDYSIWRDCIAAPPAPKTRQDWAPNPKWKSTLSAFEKLRARHLTMAKQDFTYVWPIFERRSGACVGSIDIHIIARDVLQVANLGYRIDNRYWRRGYAREAVSRIIRAAFQDLKLNRLEAVIDLDNRPSIALCRALGLAREGIRRKYYYQNGEWADQVIYVAQREAFGFKPLRLR